MVTTTRWWWVRHAPVDSGGRIYGAQDPDCDTGDAARFAWLAEQLPAGAVWVTTPLRRTAQTAAAIQAAWPAPGHAPSAALVEPRFQEQNFGDWQGLTHAELAEARSADWHRFWLAPAEEAPPGGESFAAVAGRVAEAIAALTRAHAGADIVAVAHGGPIKAAIARALELTPEGALTFATDNCAITRLDHIAAPRRLPKDSPGAAGECWRVQRINQGP